MDESEQDKPREPLTELMVAEGMTTTIKSLISVLEETHRITEEKETIQAKLEVYNAVVPAIKFHADTIDKACQFLNDLQKR